MTAPNFSITDVVGRGVLFARAHTRSVLGVLLLAVAGGAVHLAGQYAGSQPLQLWGALVYYPATLMATAALLRLAFAADRPGEPELQPGPQGLQWRLTEWRLVLAGLLLAFLYAILILALVFTLLFVGVAFGLSGLVSDMQAGGTPEQIVAAAGPGPAVVVAVALLVLFAAFLWFALRLCLSSPATVAEQRVMVFQTFAWTKGRTWKLLGTVILASLPALLASVVAGGVVSAVGAPASAEEGAPNIVSVPIALALGAFTASIAVLIQLPLSSGVYAELYRRLAPTRDAPSNA